MDLWILYQEEPIFAEYVDKYCKKHQIEPKGAIRHALVKAYAERIERSKSAVIYKETMKSGGR